MRERHIDDVGKQMEALGIIIHIYSFIFMYIFLLCECSTRSRPVVSSSIIRALTREPRSRHWLHVTQVEIYPVKLTIILDHLINLF